MKFVAVSLALVCKTTVVAFVPTQKVPAYHVSLTPVSLQVSEDNACNATSSYSSLSGSDKDTSSVSTRPSPSDEKEIDWDGLGSAAFTFGRVLAKGVEATVEAATPLVAKGVEATVEAATPLVASAASAAADTATDMAKKAKNVQIPDVKIDLPKVDMSDVKIDLPKVDMSDVKINLPKVVDVNKIKSWFPKNYDDTIPYDAAIERAYEEWKVKFNKMTPSPNDSLTAKERFELFKTTYIRTAVANVMAKKKVRDITGSWEEARTLNQVELDEFADLTDAEYYEATWTPSWGEIFDDLKEVTAAVIFKKGDSENKAPKKSAQKTASSPFQFNFGTATKTNQSGSAVAKKKP